MNTTGAGRPRSVKSMLDSDLAPNVNIHVGWAMAIGQLARFADGKPFEQGTDWWEGNVWEKRKADAKEA